MIFQAFNNILNLNAVGFHEDERKINSKNSGIFFYHNSQKAKSFIKRAKRQRKFTPLSSPF